MLNIVLFGPPGSGKGTQAAQLKDSLELLHVSTGDILRSELENNTPLGVKAREYMDAGKLVPDKVVVGMMENKIVNNSDAKGFIFDGFPRNTEQANALDIILKGINSEVSCMVMLLVDEAELINRIKIRSETSGRADDSDPSVIKHRISVFRNETMPVAEYYKKQGKYLEVDGIGTVEEIYNRLRDSVLNFTG